VSTWPTQAAFWLAASGLCYTYVAYPFLLRLLARSRPLTPSRVRPAVSVVVAAHNEAHVIAAKAATVLGQLNPGDEMVIVSDGSTDGTEAAVDHIDDPRLRLHRLDSRQGKNAALNLGASQAHGEILVFTDANALLSPGALDLLVAPFADPCVGLVSGLGLYGRGGDAGAAAGAYSRYESSIRRGEATLGFMAGVDGALYALRRELYAPLPLDLVHDLLHPIQVALARRRVVFAPGAFTVEPPSDDSASEWRRQVRIIAQGFRVLASAAPDLLRRGCIKELWMLTSHRLLRWIGWLLVLLALGGSIALYETHLFFRILVVAQLAFFSIATAGAVGERLSLSLGVFAMPYYFCLVSFAGLVGLLEAAMGRTHSVWATGPRLS
jgi:cellulose synthase/poly-beta-1,6-N-acetylglucosamine synthase-like glycosyltransferase